MSKYFSNRFSELVPYVPGEQPQDKKYIKLNTNESPFPVPKDVFDDVYNEAANIHLYSDPECTALRRQMSINYGISIEKILMFNGSDEALNFAFMTFADDDAPLAFPDITYGFYTVFADLNHIPYTEIPLKDDLSIDINDYIGINKTIVIANPNAPSGKYLGLQDIEKIVASNPDNIVIIDEAYIDFGGKSAISLIDKYRNLLVLGTFSKSRSMAGARLGFAFGYPELIADINTIKYSTNPYNVNRLTAAAGIAALKNQKYFDDNCKTIIENREWTTNQLEDLGFSVIHSMTNFVFAKTDKIGGEELYLKLKEKGILVRHFSNERIKEYNRITIGTIEQMKKLIDTISDILEEQ